MPSYNTYSFNDIIFVMKHPAYKGYALNGQGLGEITIAWADDNSAHDRSADGVVMISKIEANNGTFTMTCQQTSPLHQYLKGLFAELRRAPTQFWAAGQININSPGVSGDNIELRGVSFQKRSDQPYQAQGQMVTWNMMFADGESQGSLLPSITLQTSAQIAQEANNI
jgi:hypothetical protein